MATIAIGIGKSPGGAANATIPVNALAEDGVPPEEGDKVSFSVDGTVKSVSGNNATVSIDSVNGEPVGEEAAESPEEETTEEQGEGAAPGAGGGPSGATSGASPRLASDIAPMGPPVSRLPGIDRAGTALMRNRLLKGARGRPMPF